MLNFKWFETCSAGDRQRLEIISMALAKHPDLVKWLFKKDKPEMFAARGVVLAKARALSSGEFLLVEFACDVWFGGFDRFDSRIGELVHRLDNENFLNVMSACAKWRTL